MTKAKHFPELTEAEEAEIQRQIAADPDDEEFTVENAGKRMTFAEALPHIKRPPGRPKVDAPKVAVTLRVDPDVLETFKSGGDDWRGRMTDVLRKAAGLDASERKQ